SARFIGTRHRYWPLNCTSSASSRVSRVRVTSHSSRQSATLLCLGRCRRSTTAHSCCAAATTEVPSSNVTSYVSSYHTADLATTRVGCPFSSISSSPTCTAPIVVQPVGVGRGVSRLRALPTPCPALTATFLLTLRSSAISTCLDQSWPPVMYSYHAGKSHT